MNLVTPMTMTFAEFVAEHGIVISRGSHTPSVIGPECQCCVQEAVALYVAYQRDTAPGWERRSWTDHPAECWIDIRPVNDELSDADRTRLLVPLETRLLEVPMDRRTAVLQRVGGWAIRGPVVALLRQAATMQAESHRLALLVAAAHCEATPDADAADAADAAAIAAVAAANPTWLYRFVEAAHAAIDAEWSPP